VLTSEPPDYPEFADVGRLARRLLNRAVQTARSEDQPLRRLLLDFLGPDAASLSTVSATWPAYEHVNVQVGLEAWLEADSGRTYEVFGITGIGMMRRMEIVGIGDLLQPSSNGPFGSASFGGVMTVAVPTGPDGQTHPCVSHGFYLVDDPGTRLAIVLQPVERGPRPEVVVQITGPDQDRIQAVLGEIRALASERSVFRGQVISIGFEVFGPGRQVPLNFLERPSVGRDQIVLPADVLEAIERQVLGVGRHSGRLQASGQHLKRGVLLYGAPGTGKTHTVSYLLGQVPEATVIVISGRALERIREACSAARSLQPAIIVVEDVDLIAEQREKTRPGEHPLLFQLLNEMDGLNSGADVTFLLTTNRADLLEPALAARPGRIDLAAELPLPDADARRQLMRLYQGHLILDLAHPETVIERTEGVTAAFLKELLRKAALLACEDDPAEGAIRVTDGHLGAALDQLLDSRNQLTRVLLGAEQPHPKRPKPPKPAKTPRS
jgi:ATPase family associated with various cellular activities (AAA)